MTRLTNTEINCPHCKHPFRVIWEASINTWLDPELIQKILDDKYYYKCPNCNFQIHLVTKILINCPKGMFWMSNDENLEVKKKILENYDVIDEQGNIKAPVMGIDLPIETHPGLTSDFGIEIQKLLNRFNEKETIQENNENKKK